jgi:hypothetical protein
VHPDQRRGEAELGREVAVGDRVHGVRGRSVEAELGREHLRVDRQ